MGLELDKAFNAHRDKICEGQRDMCMTSAHDITKNQRRRHRNLQKTILGNHQLGITVTRLKKYCGEIIGSESAIIFFNIHSLPYGVIPVVVKGVSSQYMLLVNVDVLFFGNGNLRDELIRCSQCIFTSLLKQLVK